MAGSRPLLRCADSPGVTAEAAGDAATPSPSEQAAPIAARSEDSILADLKQRITDFVNGARRRPFFGRGFRLGGDGLRRSRERFSGPIT